jgi:hypothetical protein
MGWGASLSPKSNIRKGVNMENSTTHPRIVPITQRYQSVPKKSNFVFALAFFGVCSILAGIVSFVLAIILLSNGTAPAPASIMLIEPVYQLGLGALILFSSRSFATGKFLSIWLYGGSIIIDSLYHMMMGYPLNYLFVGFGLLLIWQILKFRNELELV